MGNLYSTSVGPKFHPEMYPDRETEPQFDPLYGFPNGRKERVMIATEEEMISAKVPKLRRDYCAHLLIDYYACRRKKFPYLYRCGHEKHDYNHCEYEDYVLRMKEYEREKRLIARAHRKKLKERSETLE